MSAVDPLLQVRGLKVHYRNVQAVHGIDLDVREGEVVAVLGANGAGKSSIIKALMMDPPFLAIERDEIDGRLIGGGQQLVVAGHQRARKIPRHVEHRGAPRAQPRPLPALRPRGRACEAS